MRNASAKLRRVIVGLGLLCACRPTEPLPSFYGDLGTDEAPLLPTAGSWHDAAVAKGTADWHPFRKPDPNARPTEPKSAPEPDAPAAPEADGVASELRKLVDEFNKTLADGKLDEAPDYLIEEQLAPAKQLMEIMPKFSGKMEELASAAGDKGENFKRLAGLMSPASALKLEVESIQSRGDREAVGSLKGAPAGIEAKFVLVKEDDADVWYIDHPGVRAAAARLPMLEQNLPQLDTILASIKSGQVSGDALAQQLAALDEMLGKTMPGGAAPSKPEEPSSDDK